MSGRWIATYRLQLHAGFPLSAAQGGLASLRELGISHFYLSPCLQGVPGSQHGYDVVDPTKISDDLGGEQAWSSFVKAASALNLRILLDIVPNHMSASQYNPWWDDVLQLGPYSRFAEFFDIRNPQGQPFRVHLCSLAKPYGNTWPLGPASWGELLSAGGERCFAELERLQRIGSPVEEDLTAFRRHAARAQQMLTEAIETGRLQSAVDR